jgi:hypothetical protein
VRRVFAPVCAFCAFALFRIFVVSKNYFLSRGASVRIFFWFSGLAGAARGARLKKFEWAFRPRRALLVCRVAAVLLSCCCVLWCAGVYVVVGVVLYNFLKSWPGF